MKQALEMALDALESAEPKYTKQRADQKTLGGSLDYWKLSQDQRLKAITAIKEALAQPEQCEYPRCACDNKESCKQKAQQEKEPDWKGLVLSHNADCESRCDMERCKYAPYFKANGRRCPTCPVYEIIDVDYTPPQRTWVGLTDDDDIDWEEGGNLKDLVKAIEAKLKEKNT